MADLGYNVKCFCFQDSPRRAHSIVFFFQAEDGIRVRDVTGVQTCALPILRPADVSHFSPRNMGYIGRSYFCCNSTMILAVSKIWVFACGVSKITMAAISFMLSIALMARSEERRVGKEWKIRRSPYKEEKDK